MKLIGRPEDIPESVWIECHEQSNFSQSWQKVAENMNNRKASLD